MVRFYLIAIVTTVLVLSVPELSAIYSTEKKYPQKLELTTPEKEGVLTDYITMVYDELTRRTGIEITIVELPKKRALILADNGTYDGVAMRVKGIERRYPNLYIVNVSVVSVQHVLFVQNPELIDSVHDLDSLNTALVDNNYLIGYLQGSEKARQELEHFPDSYKQPLNSPEQGFGMLKSGRIAFYLAGPGMTSRNILNKDYSEAGIKEVLTVSEFPLFVYLHKKHSELIPVLERGILSMQNDGTLTKIRQTIEESSDDR